MGLVEGCRVLDLGAGPEHFGLACKHLGCTYVGMDIWQEDRPLCARNALYDDLFRVFGLERIDLRIEPTVALDGLPRFDFITCLMGNFCAGKLDNGQTTIRWGIRDWGDFLDGLNRTVVGDRTRTVLVMNRGTVPDEVGAWLSERAEFADPAKGHYRFAGSIRL